MIIQFCVVREALTGLYVSHKEEIWGYGSTMTGPMSETVFELEPLDEFFGAYNSGAHLTIFETKDSAQKWIDSYAGKKFLENNKRIIDNHITRKNLIGEPRLEVVTFADVDSIVEQQLLGEDN